MPHRLRRSQLIELEHAAAGHEGMRSDRNGSVVVKPCHQAEIDFYETLPGHFQFQEYTPEFIGTVILNQEASTVVSATQISRPNHSHSRSQSLLLEPSRAAAPTPLGSDSWTPSDGGSIAAEKGIVLENVTHGVDKPNILDVKLGARLWADDAPLAKRQRLDRVAAMTTSGSLNFRIAGMKTWQGHDAGMRYHDLNGYRKCGKDYGRSFTAETVRDGFKEYFFPEDTGIETRHAKRVVRRFIADLKALAETLSAEESRMYSASLLFVYEGDGTRLKEKFDLYRAATDAATLAVEQSLQEIEPTEAVPVVQVTEPSEATDTASEDSDNTTRLRIQELKMIDFAHAWWTPGQGPDENILRGIRSVIQILQDLYEKA